uniref:Uncharacterized protein n=1 Tax=Opuntia streptacantha TaxID=393608 RepID=A0A7C9ANF5_OPUST
MLKELKVYPNMESHRENILESIWRFRKQETGISRAIYDHGVRGLLVSGCISWYILKGKSNLFWSLSSEHQLYWCAIERNEDMCPCGIFANVHAMGQYGS